MNPYFQYLVPKHLLSRWAGKLTNSKSIWLKNFLIRKAMNAFDISLEEAECQDPRAFETFNDFFTRALQPSARPIDPQPNTVISPADGRWLAMGKIQQGTMIQAKDKSFSLRDLLQDPDQANALEGGWFGTIYLSPQDYHRVHLPFDGKLIHTRYIPGRLFSVSPKTAECISDVFSKNERVIMTFETSRGPMVLVLVGAMLVGSIETPWHGIIAPGSSSQASQRFCHAQTSSSLRRCGPPSTSSADIANTGPQSSSWNQQLNSQNPSEWLAKGTEIGRFRFGSTVILLTPPLAFQMLEDISPKTPIKMGSEIGCIHSAH